MFTNNLLITTDSYKGSHFKQYPPGTEYISSYIECRGGKWPDSVFFGLQMFILDYLSKPITYENIVEAESFWNDHGFEFNRDGWMHILHKHNGYIPVVIKSIPEGTVVPIQNVLVQVVNTDPQVPWIVSWLETALLRAIWYPTTVATNSYECKKVIFDSLVKTSDDPTSEISFKMHDFGARGVSSSESAAIGGAAHLVNFMGTDTLEGIYAVRKYYGMSMAGFSIPAAEHSTITSWGRHGETDAYANMIDQFGKPGKLFAVVSDSYDIFNACAEIWGGELKQKVLDSGATLVVRPDSGDPTKVPVDCIKILMDKVGFETNTKGYRVLPSSFRVIQGDGITVDTIRKILKNMEIEGLSASNIAFGQGGGLLQMVNRDTMQFAMKCSAIKIGGFWQDVFKQPKTDSGKNSKKGRLSLKKNTENKFETVREDTCSPSQNFLKTVYDTGKICQLETFSEIRERANTRFN